MVLAWHHVVLRFGPLSPSLSTSHKSNLKKTALLRQILRGAAVIVGPRGSGEGPSPAVKAGPMDATCMRHAACCMHVTCMFPSLSPHQRFGQNAKPRAAIAVAAWGQAQARAHPASVPRACTASASTRDGHPSGDPNRCQHAGEEYSDARDNNPAALSARTPRISGDTPTHVCQHLPS